MKPINPITASIPISRNNHSPLIAVIVIFFVFYDIPEIWGTTILACKNNTEIFMAADSFVVKGANSPPRDCKIRQVDNFFISFAGFPFIEVPPPIRFNIVDLFRETTQKTPGPLSTKVKALSNVVKDTLTPLIEFIRQNYPLAFKAGYAKNDKLVLSLIIAGIEENKPVIFTLEYQIISSDDKPVILQSKSDSATIITPKNEPVFFIYGEHLAIDEITEREPFPSDCNAAILQKWISIETIARPDRVGLPIDILHITPTINEWIQHKKPECREIQ